MASRIVGRFGNDTFRIIEEEPERLTEVRGISERKAREIAVLCRLSHRGFHRKIAVSLPNGLHQRIQNTASDPVFRIRPETPDPEALKRLVEGGDMELDELQSRAVSESIRSGVLILSAYTKYRF